MNIELKLNKILKNELKEKNSIKQDKIECPSSNQKFYRLGSKNFISIQIKNLPQGQLACLRK